EVIPRAALLPRRPQQVRGVIGADQWNLARAVAVHGAAQLADRQRAVEQGLGGDTADDEDQLGLDERDLAVEEAAAGGELAGLRVTVVGRSAFERVRDVDALAWRAGGRKHRVEQ